MVRPIIEEEDAEKIKSMLNSVSVLYQVTPEDMAEHRRKTLSSDKSVHTLQPGKIKSLAITKIK